MVRNRKYGELERSVMECIWSHGRPMTCRQVLAELASRQPVAYTTVQTAMDRLTAKGRLAKRLEGRVNLYTAVQSREAYTAGLMADLLGRGGNAGATLLRFVEHLEPDETAQLRAALKAAEPPERRP